jgi:hypothetical protein
MKQYRSIDKNSKKNHWKKQIIVRLPEPLYRKRFRQNEYYRWLRLFYRFSQGKTVKKKHTALVRAQVPQFNFWIFNKVLGMIGYFEESGYQYQIDLTAQEEGFHIIKSFFSIEDQTLDHIEKTFPLHETTIWNLDQFDIYDRFERELMCRIYQRTFVLSKSFSEYVENDKKILFGKSALGVLMRGTDYTRKKPSGHPVQPEKEEVLEKILEVVNRKNYKYVYLTTDERENEDFLRNKLKGICEVLVNRREYFDDFYQTDIPYISSCRHERENDRMLTSMEYLSSIIILSGCEELIAGNCGGSRAAIYLNNGKYKDIYLFDLGRYE